MTERGRLTPVRRRSGLEVRWRQLRNPPPPVLRAVIANVAVAAAGGLLLLVYDTLAPADGTAVLVALYVVAVMAAGSSTQR